MRNLLKRQAPHCASKPTLRARLAAAKGKLVAVKERYGRTLRVHRALNAPVTKPEPVERAALVNYATWLFYERRLVCGELYPGLGVKAANFVNASVAADQFHFPPCGQASVGPPSTRAVATLDALGIDWRRDREEFADHLPDAKPVALLPFGWPALDAELTEALDDLSRLDAAIEGLHSGNPRRDADTVPGYETLSEARGAALDRLATGRARGLSGLQAKAHALLTDGVEADYDATASLAESLARDVIGARRGVLDQLRPDPIFAVIEEAWRLTREHGRLHDVASRLPDTDPAWEPAHEAHDAMWGYVETVLLKTVPQTAGGCTALARFALAFTKDQGVPVAAGDDSNLAVLDLIARSPLRV